MDIKAFNAALEKYEPFANPAYNYMKNNDLKLAIEPARKLHFYLNTNGRHIDRIQVDDEFDHKVTTVATINKREPYQFTINDTFWAVIPVNKQKGLYSLIAQMAATPIKDRQELDDNLIDDITSSLSEESDQAIYDYINSLQPVIDQDEDGEDTSFDDYSEECEDNDDDEDFDEDSEIAITDEPAPSVNLKAELQALQKHSDGSNKSANVKPIEDMMWDEMVRELKEAAHTTDSNGTALIFNNVLEQLAKQNKIFLDDQTYSVIKHNINKMDAFLVKKCQQANVDYKPIYDAKHDLFGAFIAW